LHKRLSEEEQTRIRGMLEAKYSWHGTVQKTIEVYHRAQKAPETLKG